MLTPSQERAAAIIARWIEDAADAGGFKLELHGDTPSSAVELLAEALEAEKSALFAACRELAKYLKTENDKQQQRTQRVAEMPDDSATIIARLNRTENEVLRDRAELLRLEAEEIEARDAAIERFRKALAEVEQ